MTGQEKGQSGEGGGVREDEVVTKRVHRIEGGRKEEGGRWRKRRREGEVKRERWRIEGEEVEDGEMEV